MYQELTEVLYLLPYLSYTKLQTVDMIVMFTNVQQSNCLMKVIPNKNLTLFYESINQQSGTQTFKAQKILCAYFIAN